MSSDFAMRRLFGIFLLGLAAVLPAGLVVYVIARALIGAERMASQWLGPLLPEGVYVPGTGLAAAIGVIFLAGLFARSWLGPPVGRWISARVGRIPVLGPIYLSLRDVARRFSQDRPRGFQCVVFAANRGGGGRLGLVADLEPLATPLAGQRLIPVYFPAPFSPGGDLELIPKADLEVVDMSVDDAISLVLSGGLARVAEAEA